MLIKTGLLPRNKKEALKGDFLRKVIEIDGKGENDFVKIILFPKHDSNSCQNATF